MPLEQRFNARLMSSDGGWIGIDSAADMKDTAELRFDRGIAAEGYVEHTQLYRLTRLPR